MTVGIYQETAKSIIRQVVNGITVRVPACQWSIPLMRDAVNQAALKLTDKPVQVITEPCGAGLIVRLMDMSKVRPFSDLEKEAQQWDTANPKTER